MAGVGESLWRLYEASPPALLAVLLVVVYEGGTYLYDEVQAVRTGLDELGDRADEHEMLLDHYADRLDDAKEARRRNRERVNALLRRQAAAHAFQRRDLAEQETAPSADPKEDPTSDAPDPSDPHTERPDGGEDGD